MAATVANGLLAGGSLIKSLVELPARHRIGLPAMAAYNRAVDLGPGLALYPTLGLGASALTFAAAFAIYLGGDVRGVAAWWAYIAAVLSVAHIFTTVRAAPTLLRLRGGSNEQHVLGGVYARFVGWQGARAIFQVVTFIVIVLALASAS